MPKVELTIGFGSDEQPVNWDKIEHVVEMLQVIFGKQEVAVDVVDPGQVTGPVQALVKDKVRDKKPAKMAPVSAKVSGKTFAPAPNGNGQDPDDDPDSDAVDNSLSVAEQRERSMAIINQLNLANLKDEWRAIRTALGVVKFIDVPDAQVGKLYQLAIEAAEKAGLAI